MRGSSNTCCVFPPWFSYEHTFNKRKHYITWFVTFHWFQNMMQLQLGGFCLFLFIKKHRMFWRMSSFFLARRNWPLVLDLQNLIVYLLPQITQPLIGRLVASVTLLLCLFCSNYLYIPQLFNFFNLSSFENEWGRPVHRQSSHQYAVQSAAPPAILFLVFHTGSCDEWNILIFLTCLCESGGVRSRSSTHSRWWIYGSDWWELARGMLIAGQN